jgi:hypothetical protein
MKTFAGCSITSDHKKEQVLSEYLWFWIALSLIGIAYGTISLVLRGYCIPLFGLTGGRPVHVEEADGRTIASWRSLCVNLLW